MKIENLAAKRFFINCDGGKYDLLPASGIVELPDGYDKSYVLALEKQGRIKIHDALDIEDAVIVETVDREALEAEYLELADDEADGRWSDETLQKKIDALKAE